MNKREDKKVAVVGAGIAGLALAWHLKTLSKHFQVMVFDPYPENGGASSVGSGLLHPFTSDFSRQVPFGFEAMIEASRLLFALQKPNKEPLYADSGILKIPLDQEQIKACSHLPTKYGRVTWLHPDKVSLLCPLLSSPYYGLMIENGKTVFMKEYLKDLTSSSQKLGVTFIKEKFDVKQHKKDFDHVILCIGASLYPLLQDHLAEKLIPIQCIKGQLIECHIPKLQTDLSCSLIAKGYLGVTVKKGVYHLGGTYEHHYRDEKPEADKAISILRGYYDLYAKSDYEFQVLRVHSGIRVAMKGSKLPQIIALSDKVFAITGLGSKGLLYHAILAKMLAEALVYGDPKRILSEFFSKIDIHF